MRKLIVLFTILCCIYGSNVLAASMVDYCQTPPFVNTSAAPNILLVVDISGSMSWKAYSGGYDPNKIYEGYYDPTKNYIQDTNGVWVEATGGSYLVCNGTWSCQRTNNPDRCVYDLSKCSTRKPYKCCSQNLILRSSTSGNYLNYQKMSRMDLLRWAMTGGKPASCDGNSLQKCDPEIPTSQLSCDIDGCILQTTSGEKIKGRWDRITGENGGLLFQLKDLPLQPRIGVMFYSNQGVQQTVYIGDFVASASFDGVNPYKNTITTLNYMSPNGATPTGPALWAAYAYLSQSSPVFGSPQPQTGAGNKWKNPLYQCKDANNDGNCQGNEFVLVPCAKTFIILLTDGQWNVGGPPNSVTWTCTIDRGYENYSADPVVPAYWLHKKGYTNVPTGIQSYVESLYTIGLWLGGTGATSLKNVAMYGAFDRSRLWPGNKTDYPKTTCTMDDCGSGKGSSCTSLPPSSPDWDKDANNIPDTFYDASNAAQIKYNMMTIILDILRRASSGTAVSVLSSSEGSGANLIQALFYPKRTFGTTEISWVSDVMNYWYYMDPFFTYSQIREDTVRENSDYTLLDLKNDYITNFVFDATQNKTLAHRWQDIDGNGSADTDRGSVPIEEAKAIWRGGFNLWWTDPVTRFIKTSTGSGILSFSTSNAALLRDYLGVSSDTEAKKVINYVRGYDCVDVNGLACTCGDSGCLEVGRGRTVTTGVCSVSRSPCNSDVDCPAEGGTCAQETHVWKMGDVISSTPRIMGPTPLNNYNISPPVGYSDQTYYDFIRTDGYKNRGRVFVGANDGMLHVFRLGKLLQDWTGKEWWQSGKLEGGTGTGGVGFESWAFIPKNILPYLQYTSDVNYCHVYMVDGPITLFDASINGAATDAKTVNSWGTIMIGSMGIGGATSSSPAAERVVTPTSVAGNPVGWSSYFAIDVTDQDNPQLLWEFSDPDLGMSNVGPAIVKVGGKACSVSGGACTADSDCGTGAGQCVSTNGNWYAVLASGPTGPITNQEFQGKSNQNLRLFILDLKTGVLLRTIDTGISNAFAGSMSANTLDLEKNNPSALGNYQDDVVYIGYVQNDTHGGVLRLVIDDQDYSQWTVSKVIDGIGPVTTSIVNLLDRKNGKLWLYFGEGRYFHKTDDLSTQRRLFGIQDPCVTGSPLNAAISCTTTLSVSALQNQTTPSATLPAGKQGWYINLDAATAAFGAERVISNPVTSPGGAVYFISFAPTADICSFGGTTYLWAVDYKTGGKVSYAMQGKALIQVSTGEIKELDLSLVSTFPDKNNRRSGGMQGIPPTGQGLLVVNPPGPMKKFMHVQER